MKSYQKSIIAISFIILQLSCNNAKNNEPLQDLSREISAADSATVNYVSSSAAVETNKDTSRKFIRTADLKFKVKDVIRSTYDIEDITTHHGGFVTNTELRSVTDNTTTTPVSADSSLETIYYTVINTITLRVPNTKLDTVLKDIAHNIDYLDYRIIKAEDVALQMLSNNLTEKRNTGNAARLISAIDTRGKKLNETTEAEETLLDKQEQADNAKLANLSLKDQVNFSTINLSLYQRQGIKSEMVANEKSIQPYEPGLGKKLIESLKWGWKMLEALLVFIVGAWWLILIAFVAFILYKKVYPKKDKL